MKVRVKVGGVPVGYELETGELVLDNGEFFPGFPDDEDND